MRATAEEHALAALAYQKILLVQKSVGAECAVLHLGKSERPSGSFTNLDYKAATFYLDSRIPPECVPNDGTPQYDIVDVTKKISYNNNSNFTRVAEDQVMLLIPQKDEDLEVTTKVTYKKRRPDGSDSPYLNAVPDVAGITYVEDNVNGWSYTAQKTTEFGQALKAGSRYYIQMTFTSSAVSINIVTSAEWEDLSEDVYHEFE